jgi:tetratricopeptide (TPR) repeat protein
MKQAQKSLIQRSKKGFSVIVAAMTMAIGGTAVHEASAADACISSQAKAALSECPAGAIKSASGKKPQVSFKQAPQGVSLKKKDDLTKPINPSESMNAAQRDDRKNRLQARSRQLLVTEIQGLESLFGDTKKNAPDRPKLARRLAEGYVELEAAGFREMTENEIKAADFKKKGKSQEAGQAATAAGTSKKVLEAARKNAIKYYSLLKDQYPKWCQQPNASDPTKSTGCGDEVLYYLAYEYEQAKDYDRARKVYLELIQNWAKSKYIPNAYLAFGELFFQEAQGDPSKWGFAEQSYLEVIKYPPPDNKVFGYAHYKLGYVHWNQGEYAKAMSDFKAVIDYGNKFAQLPNAPQLAQSARRDIIPVYGLSGDPRKAYTFFKPLSGDDGNSNDKTFKMMDELGLNYLDTGHYPEGIALYQDLMNRDKGSKWCKYQGHITEATMALKSGDKDSMMRELSRQGDVYKEYKAASYTAEEKTKCGNITAAVMTETAMAWHLEAVGSGGVRGTGDAKTMKLSADLYEKVVGGFSQDDFSKFSFPRILKDDWPTVLKIKYAMADLLYFQKNWEKCGPAFDSVVAEDPKGPQAAEAAFASVLCYQNIYTERHKDGSDKKGSGNLPGSEDKKKKPEANDNAKFAKMPLDDKQKGMLTAFNRYVCYITPAEGDKEAKKQYVEVKYARARTYFEAKHWEEAALGFREVALNHSDHEVGIFAAQLYLESVNVLGQRSEPPRPTCFEDMATDVPQFIKLYCEGGKKSENEEQCGILFRIQRDIERLRAETLVKACDAGGVGAIENCRKGAELYMEIWSKYGKDPCERNQKDACAKNDEILYNAARAYQAARLVAKAIGVRKTLIDPKYNLHETENARKAVYEIGGNYQAIAVYDEAARWYEKFADENPKMEQAAQSLSDATVLRLGLGQEDQAIKNADLFNKNYGQKKPAESAQINFAIGAHYVDREDWGNARKRLSGAMGQVDRNGTLDVQIQAHGLLARTYTKLGSKTQAKGEYDKVRGYWKNPTDQVKKLNALGGDEGTQLRRLGKVLTAVGEAYFFSAEEKKEAVDKIQFPVYKGSGDKAEVLTFVKTKVADWIGKKKPAIADAEKEYLKILDLQPVPPPVWVIAAGSRVGQMKGKFVAEFRAAPIPSDWKQNGPSPYGDLSWEEIRGTYYDSLDQASEPIKQEAKAAYKTCLDLSVKHQYFDEFSRTCERWLSKNYPADYHLIDEFRGAPSRVGSGLTERVQVLNADGSAYVEAQADDGKPAPTSSGPSGGSSSSAPATKTDAKDAPKGSKEDDALNKAKRN